MTREEFEQALWDINDYQGKRSAAAEARVLMHDAEQRVEISQAHKTNEYLALQIQEWERICGERQEEIARLREVLKDIVCAWAFIGGCNEVSRMIDKGRLILEEKNIALEEAL